MNRSAAFILIAGALFLMASAPTWGLTVSPPHDATSGYSCASCHISHRSLGGTGYSNICLNCHRPGDPKAGGMPFTAADFANPFGTYTNSRTGTPYQTSHNWQGSETNALAGALPPVQALMTTGSLRARTNYQLSCVRCHNQHDNTYPPFLRMANDQDQMCLDCHRQRNTVDQTRGTHPVAVDYASRQAASPALFKPFSTSSGLTLPGGKVLCSSCHSVHYTDSRAGTQKGSANFLNLSTGDGYILRTSLHGATANTVNLCTDCHIGKKTHNARNQNAQCGDCHGGHVDLGDGSTPNVWLVRRQLTYSSVSRSARPFQAIFTSMTRKNYKNPAGTGICQVCHVVPVGTGYPTDHESNDPVVCNACHGHNSGAGSFSVGAGGCSSCHGYPPQGNTAGGPRGYAVYNGTPSPFTNESTGAHPAHAAIPYQKACVECHRGNTHITGTFTDVFILAGPILSIYTSQIKPQYDTTAMTCSNVYCHSNGAPRGGTLTAVVAPSWSQALGGGAGSIIGTANECSSCHGSTAATMTTNSHSAHLAGSIDCASCHTNTVNPGKVIKDVVLHVNGIKDVYFDAINPGGVKTVVSNQLVCSNLYCHSNAQGVGGTGSVTYRTPTWGGTINGCGGCHQNMATFAVISSGSHKTHANTQQYSCSLCHGSGYTASAVTATTHVDKQINVVFTGIAVGSATPYSKTVAFAPGTAYGTCSSVYCHSTVKGASPVYKTVTWGAAAPCGACHVNMASDAGATGSHIQHAQTAGYACSVCHSGAGTGTLLHANRQIDFSFTAAGTGTTYSGGTAASPTAAYGTCSTSNCHGAQNPTWGANTGKIRCAKCHGYRSTPWNALSGATATTDSKAGTHFNHISSTTYKYSRPFSCAECHATSIALISDDVNAAGHFGAAPAEVSFGALAQTGGLTPTYSAGTCNNVYCHSVPSHDASPSTRVTPTWNVQFLNGTSSDCGSCHGNPPGNTAHATIVADQCKNCHPHVNNDRTFNDLSKHINGQLDGGESAGGVDCTPCHSAFANTMNTDTATYHHVVNPTSLDYNSTDSCLRCHADHDIFSPVYNPSNPSVSQRGRNLLVAPFTVPTQSSLTATTNTDFDATSGGLCLTCHQSIATKTLTSSRQKDDGTTTNAAVPRVTYTASMHNYTSSSTFSDGSKFNANCAKCHNATNGETSLYQTSANQFGVHASADRRLSATMGAPVKDAQEENFCFRCHSQAADALPGTKKAANGKDWYGSQAMSTTSEDTFKSFSTSTRVYRHNLKNYVGIHRPTIQDENLAYISANKHIECADCHNPHIAQAGTHTTGSTTLANVLLGASFVSYTPGASNWTSGSYGYAAFVNDNATATEAEYQICFKCHSGANTNVATWGGSGAAAWTDLGLEFNPNNATRHPIGSALSAANQLSAGALTGGWVPGMVMTCSDCHATDSAASKGPHGSSVKWMLNPNTTGTKYNNWPYTSAANNGTSSSTGYINGTGSSALPNSGQVFCLSCHVWSAGGAGHTQRSGDHGVACVRCHIRVPHGGKVTRFITDANATILGAGVFGAGGSGIPRRYVPDGNGTAFTGMTEFVKSTGSYGKSNCGTNCGEHNATASAAGTKENW